MRRTVVWLTVVPTKALVQMSKEIACACVGPRASDEPEASLVVEPLDRALHFWARQRHSHAGGYGGGCVPDASALFTQGLQLRNRLRRVPRSSPSELVVEKRQ